MASLLESVEACLMNESKEQLVTELLLLMRDLASAKKELWAYQSKIEEPSDRPLHIYTGRIN